jgi:hypothetical protein
VQDQPGLALPREDEDEKPKLDGPTKEDSQKKYQRNNVQNKTTKNNSQYYRVIRRIPRARGAQSRKKQLPTPGFNAEQ